MTKPLSTQVQMLVDALSFAAAGVNNPVQTAVLAREALVTCADLPDRAQRLEEMATRNGHNAPCYYCEKACNSLAGNPSKWPIPLCHADDPGKVKWHHIGCVSSRLAQLEAALNPSEEVVERCANAVRATSCIIGNEYCERLCGVDPCACAIGYSKAVLLTLRESVK